MGDAPLLSIVTPTRGNFSEYWLEQLLSLQGQIEFVLVYPPNSSIKPIADPRVRSIISPFKGEVMQRFCGLLNVTGRYVMALDDDDFVHPEVLQMTADYFDRFPESLVLRLHMEKIDISCESEIKRAWHAAPNISGLAVWTKQSPIHQPKSECLIELPIAPLTNRFNPLYIIPYSDRKDMHGAHIENFNNKIWRSDIVREALADLSQAMRLFGSVAWLPSWNLDRLLGLFIQAKLYPQHSAAETPRCLGHWLPAPGQLRFITRPGTMKEFRFLLEGDILLVKRFPAYGYFWNLAFWQLGTLPRAVGKLVLTKFAA